MLNQGVRSSSILTNESYLDQLNQELKNLGKYRETELVFKASRDSFNNETFWAKCENHKETITLISTNLNTVIGCYCPDKWENTKGKKDCVLSNSKMIVSGKPFLFYFMDD